MKKVAVVDLSKLQLSLYVSCHTFHNSYVLLMTLKVDSLTKPHAPYHCSPIDRRTAISPQRWQIHEYHPCSASPRSFSLVPRPIQLFCRQAAERFASIALTDCPLNRIILTKETRMPMTNWHSNDSMVRINPSFMNLIRIILIARSLMTKTRTRCNPSSIESPGCHPYYQDVVDEDRQSVQKI